MEVASDLPVTLSNSSAAYLQNSAWSEALSSMTGSRIKTKQIENERAKDENKSWLFIRNNPVVYLGKTLYPYNTSLHSVVQMINRH